MSDEPRDSELEGRLDEAFASLRPRGGFEQELWERIDRLPATRHRPASWWTWAGAAAAVVLVGAFAFLFAHVPHGGGAPGSATNRAAGSLAANAVAFGALPRPSSSAVPVDPAFSVERTADASAPAVAPEALSSEGTVVRYREPGPDDVAAFARALGAAGSGARYSTSQFTLVFFPTDARLGLPAHYVLTVTAASGPPPPSPPAADAAESAAQAFLGAHGLPAGPVAGVTAQGPFAVVRYASGTQAFVRADGVVGQVTGPTGVGVASSTYPLAPAAQLQAAAHAPAGAAPRLTTALVSDGTYWYLEPVAVFGAVTVPAIDPSHLR